MATAPTQRPAGTVTFLLTDIEGSTRAWDAGAEEMRGALARHDAILSEGIAAHGGTVLTERGEGDSFFAVFARASDAVTAACAIQRALAGEAWPPTAPVRVRMAIHTGEADGDYRGPDVNRCARLRALAHGGQVLVSQPAQGLVRGALPEQVTLQDLGRHRLRDLSQPERVFQVVQPGLPGDFPPPRSLDSFRHNLPVQLSSFIGRDRERAELERLVREQRLVTVVGSGGTGKTRLALQVAAELVDELPDGVYFVDLAGLSDEALVPQAVAAALDVRESAEAPLVDTVIAQWRESGPLLLLDNCEHLVGECARVTAALLRGCPQLRVLATSREALGIAGEVAWRVPSLDTPGEEHVSDPERLRGYEAVRLFAARASAARAGFTLEEDNAATVARICARLDGVPLAIELAAARVRALSPEEILQRLRDRFRLLTGGDRAGVARQQTLAAAVEWSHALLTDAERVAFRRLSVFAGGFRLDGADWVCGNDPVDVSDVLDIVGRLVDKSLVNAEEGEDGSTRYRLLETLRQYGAERLRESGESERVRARHLAYFLDLAERGYAGRFEADATWLGRLEAEHDNLRAALQWSAGHDPDAQLRLAGALAWFWFGHSHLTEGRRHLRDALEGRSERTAPVARALWGASVLAVWQGDSSAGRAAVERSLSIWRELGDLSEATMATEALGWAAFWEGDDTASMQRFEEALDLAAELDDARLVNRARSGVCQVLMSRSILADPSLVGSMESLAQELLDAAVEADDAWLRGNASHFLSDAALIRGDGAEAERRYAHSLRSWWDQRDLFNTAVEMQGLAMALAAQGRAEKALRLGGAAEAVYERLGSLTHVPCWDALQDRWFGAARGSLGREAAAVAWEQGRRTDAEQAVADALDPSRD